MTTQQANTVRDLLLANDGGDTFVGADIRPANESDSIYGIPVNPDGADLFVGVAIVDDEGEARYFVTVVDPVGAVTINYEAN
jgi:hypothetical protein